MKLFSVTVIMASQVSSSFSPSKRPHASVERRDSYLRRFHLLRYHDVTKLREVMEMVVPIHGSGNFPTLEIRPSLLIQVRSKSSKMYIIMEVS